MLGILLLCALAYQIGKRAEDKDKNRYLYWFLTALVWFGGQFVVAFLVGMIVFAITGEDAHDGLLTGSGLVGGIIGYWLLYRHLDRIPDESEAERKIRELGRDDSEEADESY